MSCRIVVLISGSGSNLQALIDAERACALGDGEIVGVFSNRPDAAGLTRAAQAGIPTTTIDHKAYSVRAEFDRAMQADIDAWAPDLLVLAGFMRLLTPDFVAHFVNRMLNIHPSLLPRYPGLNTHQRALDAGDTEHGVTVHFVTTELDGGPPVVQARVPVEAHDDAASLAKKVQRKEHQIYPAAVRWFADGRLTMSAGNAYMDGNLIVSPGLEWHDIIH